MALGATIRPVAPDRFTTVSIMPMLPASRIRNLTDEAGCTSLPKALALSGSPDMTVLKLSKRSFGDHNQSIEEYPAAWAEPGTAAPESDEPVHRTHARNKKKERSSRNPGHGQHDASNRLPFGNVEESHQMAMRHLNRDVAVTSTVMGIRTVPTASRGYECLRTTAEPMPVRHRSPEVADSVGNTEVLVSHCGKHHIGTAEFSAGTMSRFLPEKASWNRLQEGVGPTGPGTSICGKSSVRKYAAEAIPASARRQEYLFAGLGIGSAEFPTGFGSAGCFGGPSNLNENQTVCTGRRDTPKQTGTNAAEDLSSTQTGRFRSREWQIERQPPSALRPNSTGDCRLVPEPMKLCLEASAKPQLTKTEKSAEYDLQAFKPLQQPIALSLKRDYGDGDCAITRACPAGGSEPLATVSERSAETLANNRSRSLEPACGPDAVPGKTKVPGTPVLCASRHRPEESFPNSAYAGMGIAQMDPSLGTGSGARTGIPEHEHMTLCRSHASGIMSLKDARLSALPERATDPEQAYPSGAQGILSPHRDATSRIQSPKYRSRNSDAGTIDAEFLTACGPSDPASAIAAFASTDRGRPCHTHPDETGQGAFRQDHRSPNITHLCFPATDRAAARHEMESQPYDVGTIGAGDRISRATGRTFGFHGGPPAGFPIGETCGPAGREPEAMPQYRDANALHASERSEPDKPPAIAQDRLDEIFEMLYSRLVDALQTETERRFGW